MGGLLLVRRRSDLEAQVLVLLVIVDGIIAALWHLLGGAIRQPGGQLASICHRMESPTGRCIWSCQVGCSRDQELDAAASLLVFVKSHVHYRGYITIGNRA